MRRASPRAKPTPRTAGNPGEPAPVTTWGRCPPPRPAGPAPPAGRVLPWRCRWLAATAPSLVPFRRCVRRGVGGGAHPVPSASALRTVGRASASAQTVRAAWARLRPFFLDSRLCAPAQHSQPSGEQEGGGRSRLCLRPAGDGHRLTHVRSLWPRRQTRLQERTHKTRHSLSLQETACDGK